MNGKKDKMLRKPNHDIGFRIRAGEMGFLSRKIYNSLVYRAQRAGKSGKGKLPFPLEYDLAAHVAVDDYWWIPLSDVMSDASSGSRNHARVKEFFIGLMGVVVDRNVSGWEAFHILEGAKIYGTKSPAGGVKGDRLIIGWAFPRATVEIAEDGTKLSLEDKLIKPDEYTSLSLYYQSILKTEAALSLYEMCRRFVTNPSKLTSRMPWDEWQLRMVTAQDRSPTAYKEFKRYFLTPAMREINNSTDINVTLIEHRAETRGRPVESIQFLVELNVQGQLEIGDGPVIPSVISDLEAVGCSLAAAEKLLAMHGEEKVIANLKYMHERIRNSSMPAISSPMSYLKRALSEDFAAGEAAKKKTIAAKNKASAAALESLKAQSPQEFSNASLPNGEALVEAWHEYLSSPQSKLFKALPANFDDASTKVQGAFAGWWASKE